jgi:hypothetical protein
VTSTAYGPCEACGRPGVLRQLWKRPRGAAAALLVGRFAPVCFYKQARAVADAGAQPETFTARPIVLRGRP